MGYNSSLDTPYLANPAEFNNFVRYGTAGAVTEKAEGPFDGFVPMLGMMGAFQGLPWLWGNRKDLSGGWTTLKEGYNKSFDTIRKAAGVEGNGKSIEDVWKNVTSPKAYITAASEYNLKKIAECIPNEEALKKLTPEARDFYRNARLLTSQAETAKDASARANILKGAEKRLAQAHALPSAEYFLIPQGKLKGWSKVGRFFSDSTKFVTRPLNNLATKSPTLAKFLTCGKGAGFFAALAAPFELFKIGKTYNELGAGSATVQTGKSIVKTGANIGGWFAGELAGTAAATAIGAAIGSVVPVAGTAVGAGIGFVCGLAGGLLGSWGAGKVADAIVGKDELEIAEAKKARQNPQQNPLALQEGFGNAQPQVAAQQSPFNPQYNMQAGGGQMNPFLFQQGLGGNNSGLSSWDDDFLSPFNNVNRQKLFSQQPATR